MLRKQFLLLWMLLGISLCVQSAQVDTVYIRSNAMNKEVKTVCIVPQSRTKMLQRYPVIYLLHGYGGEAKTWVDMKPELKQIADEKGIIFVCPDGENSWYWDSPKDPTYRYETFVSKEMVEYVDNHYPTLADRHHRAITGLSMGGHGALWNAIRHRDVFGAAGSTSGGVDIRPFPKNWEMSIQLGTKEENPEVWETHTVINQLEGLKDGELALIFDCGFDDIFFKVNNELHRKLLEQKVGHDFISRPGGHNRTYWRNAIDYQILYFDKFFRSKDNK